MPAQSIPRTQLTSAGVNRVASLPESTASRILRIVSLSMGYGEVYIPSEPPPHSPDHGINCRTFWAYVLLETPSTNVNATKKTCSRAFVMVSPFPVIGTYM